MFPKMYPHVAGLLQFDASAKEAFPEGKPSGVVLHYTGDDDPVAGAKYLVAKDLGYHLIIDRDGSVYQMTSLDRKCWHSGRAVWYGMRPNHCFAGVALVSWGHLLETKSEFFSYTKKKVAEEEVVYRPDNVFGEKRHWQKATEKQLAALDEILDFFISHGVKPGNIVGHEEIAIPIGRKLDPGGVLPFTMPELREKLKNKLII